jgi:hypothetical protein
MMNLQFDRGGQEFAAVPHGWGAFSRAFVPPCNLAGGRQLSDQSLACGEPEP